MNKQLKLPQIQKIMMDFEKQVGNIDRKFQQVDMYSTCVCGR